MKLWEVVQVVRDMGGTMEDVRAIMREIPVATEENPVQTEDKAEASVDNSVQTEDNSELEALRLENAQLKGQLQTYNILHASIREPPVTLPADRAVEIGIDMIK